MVQGECRLKVFFLSVALTAVLFSEVQQFMQFVRGYYEDYEEQFCKIILNLGPWFRRRCRSKGISYLKLLPPSCLLDKAEPFMHF